jgi:phosphatidylglycerol:prolipoprotein diacylglycerol transferase
MIPYVQLHLPFQLFGAVLIAAVWLGHWFVHRRARQLGLDKQRTDNMWMWSIVSALVVAHLFDVIAYQWTSDGPPSLYAWLNPFYGLSSYGGFAGAVGAMYLWCAAQGEPFLPYLDSCAFGIVPGWLLGRIGCFLAHDHPGRLTSFVLAVQYPGGARHDLGLYEALVALAMTIAFVLFARARRPVGFYAMLCCVVYGPARFALDFLRATDGVAPDPRYFGLTAAQYGSLLVTFAGAWLIYSTRLQPKPAS